MLIKAIADKYADGRMGVGVYQQLKGKFKNATITIEKFGNTNEGIKHKQYIIDAPNYQKIVNKFKNRDGKFEVLA